MSFEVPAAAYDRYMGAWSRRLAPAFADLADLSAATDVLDVGCGTGSLTEVLVERLGADAVAAVDPSASFAAAVGDRLPGVEVRIGSAGSLPYPDEAFDAALAQLVVHFMTDPVAGIRDMARVTRPGGVVAACVWDYAGGRGPLGPFWEAARELDPTVDDEARLPGTRRGHLAELLDIAGLQRVEEATITAERPYDDFDSWWEPFMHGVGPGGAYVTGLDEDRRIALRERCRDRLPDGPFVLTATAWAARGRA